MATLLTAPNFTVNDNPTITYSNPDGENVTSLQICIEADDGHGIFTPVGYRDIPKTGTSFTFSLSTAEREALFSANCSEQTMPVYFRLRTVIGGKTSFSYKQRDFRFAPWMNVTIADVNEQTLALTDDETVIVKGNSWVRASVTARARKGAAIDESLYVIRNGDEEVYATEHTFQCPQEEFIFAATDSFGNESVVKATPTIVDYTVLTANVYYERPDATGKATVSCVGLWFNGNFGVADNTLTAQYRYTISDGYFGDDWTDMDVTINGNSYYASASVEIADFDRTQSYVFEIKVADKLDEIREESDVVKSIPLFHWGENDFTFEVPVTFNQGFTNNESNNEEEDTSDAENGYWTPLLDSSAISSYTTRSGWYSKVGDIVTIGFYIKASCYSGYENTSISISSLPYTPLLPTAGGGMCSGAYVASGCNFQCFVAETSGDITTRVQSCIDAADGNLSTSKSGCWYRSGGGEITLSGTITYMANS